MLDGNIRGDWCSWARSPKLNRSESVCREELPLLCCTFKSDKTPQKDDSRNKLQISEVFAVQSVVLVSCITLLFGSFLTLCRPFDTVPVDLTWDVSHEVPNTEQA